MSIGLLGRTKATAESHSVPAWRADGSSGAATHHAARVLYRVGYSSMLLLALVLPFELTHRPLLQTHFITLTNLKLVEYAVAALALACLAQPAVELAGSAARRSAVLRGALAGQALVIVLFLALLACCLFSSLLAHDRLTGLKWTLDLGIAGLLWLAMPLWLAEDRDTKLHRLGIALVLGACLAAIVGFLEFILGMRFAESLTMFKTKPTVAGSYLRLSATFEYTNIAAMYFELAFPFALVGLWRALTTPHASRLRIMAWLVAMAMLLEALLLTYSRGALFGLLVGLAAMAYIARRSTLLEGLNGAGRAILGGAGAVGLLLMLVTLSSSSLGLLRLTSQSDQDWYRAAYLGNVPATMSACQLRMVPITVVNRSPLDWQATGSEPYQLGYHWLNSSSRMVEFEGLRTPLSSDLTAGSQQLLQARLRAPAAPGRYLLVWDMVQEGVTWFSLKSANYQGLPVVVRAAATQTATVCKKLSASALPASAMPALPTALAQPGRRQLWQAAVAMVAAHPLFGVGPDGFRLNFGRYSSPKQQTWDDRILANSLYLETFADLGLIGGALFFALLIALAWRPLRELRARRRVSLPQLAILGALAAFLGHGLVDTSLQSHAIFILFWLLCGMLLAGWARTTSTGEVTQGQAQC